MSAFCDSFLPFLSAFLSFLTSFVSLFSFVSVVLSSSLSAALKLVKIPGVLAATKELFFIAEFEAVVPVLVSLASSFGFSLVSIFAGAAADLSAFFPLNKRFFQPFLESLF